VIFHAYHRLAHCCLFFCAAVQMLEHPGRPVLTTVDNNTPCPQSALLEYIPPIQTRPYDMLRVSREGLDGVLQC
jgi:hypothetical protein